MICKFCATGADMQSRAKEITENAQQDTELSWHLRKYGKQLHEECKGKGSCDCQHRPQT